VSWPSDDSPYLQNAKLFSSVLPCKSPFTAGQRPHLTPQSTPYLPTEVPPTILFLPGDIKVDLVLRRSRRDSRIAYNECDHGIARRLRKVASAATNSHVSHVVGRRVRALQDKATIILRRRDDMIKGAVHVERAIRVGGVLARILLCDGVDRADGAHLNADDGIGRIVGAGGQGLVDDGEEALGRVGDDRRVCGRDVSSVVLVEDQGC
jgi:hypothetical protein